MMPDFGSKGCEVGDLEVRGEPECGWWWWWCGKLNSGHGTEMEKLNLKPQRQSDGWNQ